MKVAQSPAKPEEGDFDITLRFVNTPTVEQQEFFEVAAAQWQGIIVGDVPSTTGRFPPRTCSGQIATPGFNGTIDDVMIDALLTEIDGDGGILGAAGPCLVRTSDNLTVYGVMYFDTADLDFLEDLGLLDEVVVHEMGHVLGFGTLWDFHRTLLDGAGTADPRFTGPLAIAAYDNLGGSGTVPVEGDQGGAGTRDSHWDEATFYNELMTGFLNSSAKFNPLSDLSVAAMGDLGYVVTLGTGDSYHLPRPSNSVATISASVAGQGRGINLGRREQLLRPVAAVE